MPGLVDTNILVYRFDRRFPEKRAQATAFLRRGLERDELRLARQTLVEFIAAVTRSETPYKLREMGSLNT